MNKREKFLLKLGRYICSFAPARNVVSIPHKIDVITPDKIKIGELTIEVGGCHGSKCIGLSVDGAESFNAVILDRRHILQLSKWLLDVIGADE